MRALLLLASLLLAGCALAPEPPAGQGRVLDAPGCHERPAAPSGNAPLAAGFLGPPEEVLARLAAHLGANVTSGLVEVEPQRWTQWTDDGEMRLERVAGVAPYGPSTYLGWTGNRSWLPAGEDAPAWVDRLLRAFEVDPATVHVEEGFEGTTFPSVSFHQSFGGQRVGFAGGELRGGSHDGARVSLDLHGLHRLPEAPLPVAEAAARETAERHARCVLDAAGRSEADGYAPRGVETSGLALHGDSLVHAVLVRFEEPGEPSHCGMAILVQVDAVTGTVLDAGRPPCD